MYLENPVKIPVDELSKHLRRQGIRLGDSIGINGQTVQIVRTPTGIGRGRPNFICPCGLRVRVLFVDSKSRFGCRCCLHLKPCSAYLRRSPFYPLFKQLMKMKKLEDRLSAKHVRKKKRKIYLQNYEVLAKEVGGHLEKHSGG